MTVATSSFTPGSDSRFLFVFLEFPLFFVSTDNAGIFLFYGFRHTKIIWEQGWF